MSALSKNQQAKWERRQTLVRQCAELRVGQPRGCSMQRAARELGEPIANLSRWLRAYAAGGAEALRPGVSTGRPPSLSLSEPELAALRAQAAARKSVPAALAAFGGHAVCMPGTRAAIAAILAAATAAGRPPRWPARVLRAARRLHSIKPA